MSGPKTLGKMGPWLNKKERERERRGGPPSQVSPSRSSKVFWHGPGNKWRIFSLSFFVDALVIRKCKKKGGRRIENATCNAHHYVPPPSEGPHNEPVACPNPFLKELFVDDFLGREQSRKWDFWTLNRKNLRLFDPPTSRCEIVSGWW